MKSPDAIWNDALWDELETIVSKALGKTIEAYEPKGMPSLEHGRIVEILSTPKYAQMTLPMTVNRQRQRLSSLKMGPTLENYGVCRDTAGN